MNAVLNPTLFTISATPQVCWTGYPNAPGILFQNTDPINTVSIGSSSSLTIGDANSYPILGGQSINLPGTQTWYAIGSAGTKPLAIVPGGNAVGGLFINAPFGVTVNVPVGTTVDIGNTPSVAIASGSVNITTSAPIDVSAANVNVIPLKNISLIGSTGVLAAGALSGVTTFAMPSQAEGYLLEMIPQNPGTRIFAADILITHVDAAGHNVAFEQVTVSNWQNIGNNPAVIRGRLIGTSIKVQAQVAASAWMNTITGGSVTADSIVISAFALPVYVPNTGKRVPIIASADGLLLGNGNTVLLGNTAGNATFVGVLPDYTGPITMSVQTEQGGGTTFSGRIRCYTVSNGTGTLAELETPPCTIVAPQSIQTSLPSCFNVAYMVQRITAAGVNVGMSILINAADQ